MPTREPTSDETGTTEFIIGVGVAGGVLVLMGIGAVVAMCTTKQRLPALSEEGVHINNKNNGVDTYMIYTHV